MQTTVPEAGLLLVLMAGAPGAPAQAHNVDVHPMAREWDRLEGSGGLFKEHDVDFHAMARKAVKKSVPLLQKGAAVWIERSNGTCFSCHNQSLPVMATGLARERGYSVNQKQEREVAEYVYRFFAEGKETLQKALTDPKADHQVNRKLADPVIVVGYALATLQAAEWPADETTGAMARFLAHRQAPEGRWRIPAARPPMEGSEFTATALAIRGLQTYMPKEHARERTERIARARAWLIATLPKTTEDKAFRLFGLRWAIASPKVVRKAVQELLAEQRDDGGWGQLPNLASDAYATGHVCWWRCTRQAVCQPMMRPTLAGSST